jgi:WD40-like Beta Propeller Repeat
MNDQQVDRLVQQLDIAATPNSEWVNASIARLLPTARQARRRDASPLGRAELVLAGLRRLLWGSGSRRTLLSIAVGLLLTGMLGTYLVGTSNREPAGGQTGLLVVVTNGKLEAIDVRDSSTIELLPPGTVVSAVSRSPDGRLLAFRIREGSGDHYEVMATDGTGRRPVATDLTVDGESCHDVWSPDSRFLVTGVDVVGGNKGRIVVIDVSSGEARFVTPQTEQAGCPIWSPDGQWIAYTTSDLVLERVRADGTGSERLATDAGGATSWSDDGWIYWDNPDRGVNRTQVETRKTGTVSDPRFGTGHAPALAPDGTQLAVIYGVQRSGPWHLYVSAPDGSDAHRLASDVLIFDGWSADGQYLLFVWAPPPDSVETGGLVALKPDGTGRRLIRRFDATCRPTDDSSCFRDIGWGQSRP